MLFSSNDICQKEILSSFLFSSASTSCSVSLSFSVFLSSHLLFSCHLSGCLSFYFHLYVDLLSNLYLPPKFHLSFLSFFLPSFLPFFLSFFLIRYATALVAWWEIAMFFIFAFAYKTILTVPTYFCVWYVRAIRKYFGEKL